MDRRLFLKMSGLVAAATALQAAPVSAQGFAQPDAQATMQSSIAPIAPEQARLLPAVITTVAPRQMLREAGAYRISGIVRLEQLQVEVFGDVPAQQISWSGHGAATTPFTAYAQLTGPGLSPEIQVRGGRIESLLIEPLGFE